MLKRRIKQLLEKEMAYMRDQFFWKSLRIQVLLYLLLFCNVNSKSNSLKFTHYTAKDGLHSSYIKSIVQDKEGFIWVAKRVGISRFDGKMFRDFPVFDVNNKPIELFCNKLFLTPDSILVAQSINGIYYYYSSNTECFFPYKNLNKFAPYQKLLSTPEGIWIKKADSLFVFNQQNGQLEEAIDKLKLAGSINDQTINTLIVNHGWLIISSGNLLHCYNIKNKELINHRIPPEIDLPDYRGLFLDSQLNLWLSSFYYGILKYNIKTQKSISFSKNQNENLHIPDNFVHCVVEDSVGRIWIGTESGLAVYENETHKMSIYNHQLLTPDGLNTDPIYNAFCDNQGNIWLGTYFGGINFWSNEESFFRTWSPGIKKGQIKGSVVRCFTEDHSGALWIGLEDKGLNKYDPKTGEITHFEANGNQGLSNNNLHDLLFVNKHELWIATYTGGINVLNTHTNKFKHFTWENSPGLTTNDIRMFDRHGDSIFILTNNGIAIYSLIEKKFSRLKPELIEGKQFFSICKTNNIIWFSSRNKIYQYFPDSDSLCTFNKFPDMNGINFVKADSKGRIWIGDCYRGLCCYDEEINKISNFNPLTGFPSSWIFSLEEGDNGWFWAGTDKGLVKFSPEKKSILYDINSGVPLQQFNYTASFSDSKGNIYFGGTNGMISFNKATVPLLKEHLPIAFTDIQLFNKTIHPGDLKHYTKSINKIKELKLNYNQNIVTLGFSVLNYGSPEIYKYSYYLKGFEANWNEISSRNSVSYTNLNPGKYTFKVRAYKDDYEVPGGERMLQIVVLPPFWLTWMAYAIYFIVVCFIIMMIFRIAKNIEKMKSMIELEHQEKLHAEETHRIKMEFFTNISHELKTPLILILGPALKILEREKKDPLLRKDIGNIKRNAERLLTLINQLLSFRKIESKKETLKVSYCNLTRFTEETVSSFKDVAHSKHINFVAEYPTNNEEACIDTDKVDKVIYNLLSNAFKYTPSKGEVKLSVQMIERQPAKSNLFDLIVIVKDNGNGIKQGDIEKVFECYYQGRDNQQGLGVGIGLAYTKSIVSLHGGTINVESIINRGTTFTVKIPASLKDYPKEEFISESKQEVIHNKVSIPIESQRKRDEICANTTSTKPHILIVEDNVELLDFLEESLESEFIITTAFNGVNALEKLERVSPELIVSDIMMPEMNGTELTVRLKTDLKFSHIPVILLTSKSGVENKLDGLRTGADLYIEKPFYPELLEQNIKNVLNTRKNVIARFKSGKSVSVNDMAISESDKVLLDKIVTSVMNNLSNPDLDVNFIIKEIGISRTLLHTKLKKLVGCSSTEFIRSIRLKEAKKLISSGKYNISEAAYETGFSSPQYFSKRFREFFGKSPRDYFEHQ